MILSRIFFIFLRPFVAWLGALCFSISVTAQTPLDTLKNKFDNYRKNGFQEKIFVHTNQEVYLSGEQIWFKAYYFDGSQHLPTDLSAVAYVDILNKNDSTVGQVKIKLHDGGGDGYLALPSTIPSGTYRFRTYTNWMKNFSPEFYFQKSITIINPFSRLKPEKESIVRKWDAQFFPEGGNMVAGLPGKVAFQVKDQNGKGMVFKGSLITAENDTILSFHPLKSGTGCFTFTPSTSKQYRGIIQDLQGRKEIFDLPSVREAGYALNVKDSAAFVVVTIRSTSITGPAYLFVHARQIVSAATVVHLQAVRTKFVLDKKKFAEGISHITLFDANLQPVCERLFYQWPDKQLHIEANTASSEFGNRSKVTLNLATKNQDGIGIPSQVSISVFHDDSLSQNDVADIYAYLWLTSDLQGEVESPESYTSQDTPNARESMDLVMLTHGWRRFKWEDVLMKEKPVIRFVPEFRGHLATGVIQHENGSPAAGVPTCIATPGSTVQLYTGVSNQNGEVIYELRNYYGSGKVVAQRRSSETTPFLLKLSTPFSASFSKVKLPPLYLPLTASGSLTARAVALQVQGAYHTEEITAEKSKDVFPAFYGKPDEVYRLDDYTRFPLMEEVMREYIKGVWVRKNKDGFRFMIVDKDKQIVLRENPLILLDGLPIADADRIIEMDPLKIQSLEVFRRIFHLGQLTFPGIVSFRTYTGDLAGFIMEPQSAEINYDGLQQRREFFSPSYPTVRTRDSRIPDRRCQLFWSPAVTTDNEGKGSVEFYTSDISGTFTVIVQGSSHNGEVGRTTLTFKVTGK